MKHDTALASFVRNNMQRAGVPVPLKATSYEISVASGLAVVRLSRTFRNDEDRPIEATVTFPVPFDCAVTGIEARVAGRVLTGKAQAKAEARQAYEDAVDAGKPAVLHEELLRGIHMLSVANVAPGAEIEVVATFVSPLSLDDGSGRFRIPVTVGQVYGDQPLVDSDRIVTGGPVQEARVTVSAATGTAFANGAPAGSGIAVKLDSPIEVKVVGLYDGKPTVLRGRAADGREVELSFLPAATRDVALDADFLLDVSGSMKEGVERNPEGHSTKWDAVLGGLSAAAGSVLGSRDKVTVWTFSDECRRVGSTSGDRLGTLDIPFVSGGTELPEAIAKVTDARNEANVLLVTDGKTWLPIDVQKAAASGARFTVVLVGEDALESSVGYLAAMTGGQMFIASGADVRSAVVAAVASMRNVASPVGFIKGSPSRVARRIAGTEVLATWSMSGAEAPERKGEAAAYAAYAAQLAIAGMAGGAAEFAASEGIVSHLTSIVLVDEAAEAVEGIPATRKVALASPATSAALLAEPLAAPPPPQFMAPLGHSSGSAMSFGAGLLRAAASWCASLHERIGGSGTGWRSGRRSRYGLPEAPQDPFSEIPAGGWDAGMPDPLINPPSAGQAASRAWLAIPEESIDWDADPSALAKGELRGLPATVIPGVLALSALAEVAAVASALGKPGAAVALALLAEKHMVRSRGAARIVRAVLAKADPALVEAARKAAAL